MTSEYQVGQILYSIDSNRFGITPVQIIEHHVRTSLTGTDNNYFVIIGGTETKVDLSSLKGPIFDTSKDAGEYLMSKASEKIQNLVQSADDISNQSFAKRNEENIESSQKDENLSKSPEEAVYVDLPDGTRAKLSGGAVLEDFNR